MWTYCFLILLFNVLHIRDIISVTLLLSLFATFDTVYLQTISEPILMSDCSTLYLQITNIFRCARIQGLDTAEGLLLFGKEYFYIIDGLTMLKSRAIRDIDSLPLE